MMPFILLVLALTAGNDGTFTASQWCLAHYLSTAT